MASAAVHVSAPEIKAINLKNILVATDFSDVAARAIPCVRTLARKYHAQIYVCHILDFVAQYAALSTGGIDLSRTQAEFKLYEWCKENALRDKDYKAIFMSGEPADVIKKIVHKQKIDLVVLGTHGAEGVQRLLWGSVAEEIFRDLECPVLVVGPQVRTKSSGRLHLQHVLYPTDLSANSYAAAPFVSSLIQEFGAEVTLLHLITEEIESVPERERRRRMLEPAVRAMLPAQFADCIRPIVVDFTDPGRGIVEFADAEGVDLIVMGVRHGGTYARAATHSPWAIAHKVIANVSCPVLTIREKQQGT